MLQMMLTVLKSLLLFYIDTIKIQKFSFQIQVVLLFSPILALTFGKVRGLAHEQRDFQPSEL